MSIIDDTNHLLENAKINNQNHIYFVTACTFYVCLESARHNNSNISTYYYLLLLVVVVVTVVLTSGLVLPLDEKVPVLGLSGG